MNHRKRTRLPRRFGRGLAIAGAVLGIPAFGLAQFDNGVSKPWERLTASSKLKIPLGFQNAPIDRVFSYFQNVSGVSIVRDPALTGTMTLTSAKPVSVSDAFAILAANLSLRGFEIAANGDLLIVRKKASKNGNGAPQGMPGMGNGQGMPMGPMTPPGSEETSVIQVYRIKYANASQLAQTLNDVLGQASTTGTFPNFGGGGGPQNGPQGGPMPGGNGGAPVVIGGPGGGGPPPPSPSNDISSSGGRPQGFAGGQGPGGQGSGGRSGQGGFGGPGGFGGQGGPGRGPGGNAMGMPQGQTSSYRASADDFSNSIVLYAPERIQSQVKDLIEQLDRPSTDPMKSKVYKLVYASATDVETLIQNVLNANAPKGKGGATTQQNQGPSAFLSAASGKVSGAGTVTADTRTNSLVVTATDENLKVLDDVIPNLDRQVIVASSVFLFRLNFAQSDHIASLLQQALGQRQGSGTTSTGQTGRTNNTTGTLGNGNQNQNGPGGGGNGGGPGG